MLTTSPVCEKPQLELKSLKTLPVIFKPDNFKINDQNHTYDNLEFRDENKSF